MSHSCLEAVTLSLDARTNAARNLAVLRQNIKSDQRRTPKQERMDEHELEVARKKLSAAKRHFVLTYNETAGQCNEDTRKLLWQWLEKNATEKDTPSPFCVS